jgi:hypothetical protein
MGDGSWDPTVPPTCPYGGASSSGTRRPWNPSSSSASDGTSSTCSSPTAWSIPSPLQPTSRRLEPLEEGRLRPVVAGVERADCVERRDKLAWGLLETRTCDFQVRNRRLCGFDRAAQHRRRRALPTPRARPQREVELPTLRFEPNPRNPKIRQNCLTIPLRAAGGHSRGVRGYPVGTSRQPRELPPADSRSCTWVGLARSDAGLRLGRCEGPQGAAGAGTHDGRTAAMRPLPRQANQFSRGSRRRSKARSAVTRVRP